MSVVGLDFGTDSCVIAVCRKGTVDIALNEVSKRKTPTVIGYTSAERNIGEAGASGRRSNYKNTVTNIKRLLGLPFNSTLAQSELPQLTYKVGAGSDDQILIDVAYGEGRIEVSPEQVVAAIFGKLKSITEEYIGAKVSDVVVSCPPNWPDTRRRSLLDAARVAGFNVLRLMNETTAVALNYGILRPLPADKPIRVVFVDMGFAHTQAAVVELQQGKLTMLGHECDEHIGGRDLTRLLTEHLAGVFKEKTGLDVLSNPKGLIRLSAGAEKLKKTLSANSDGTCNVECMMEDTDFSSAVNRAQLEEMAAPYFQRITPMLQQLLKSTNTALDQVHSVEIIGGGVRVPAVRKVLADFFGKEMSTTCNGDESVARGCALQCAMLSPSFRVREFSITDCTHYPIKLGWSAVGAEKLEEEHVLFQANNSFPSIKLISFNRSDDFQLAASYATDEPHAKHGVPSAIGSAVVKVPAASAEVMDASKKPKLKVKVEVDINGIFSFRSVQVIEEIKEPKLSDEEKKTAAEAEKTAAEQDTKLGDKDSKDEDAASFVPGKTKKHTRRTDLSPEATTYVGGLDKDGHSRAFDMEVAQSNADRVVQETAEKRNELESYVYDMRAKLDDSLKDFVKPEVKSSFHENLNAMEEWLYDDGYDAQKSEYVKRINELRAVGDAIAQRHWETQHREDGVHQLKAAVAKYQAFVSIADGDKYAHISADDKAKVSASASTADEWLASVLIKQDKLPKWETPAFTVAELLQKKKSLVQTCEPISSKKAPAPKPEPKAEEPMDTASEKGDSENQDAEMADSTEDTPAEMDID